MVKSLVLGSRHDLLSYNNNVTDQDPDLHRSKLPDNAAAAALARFPRLGESVEAINLDSETVQAKLDMAIIWGQDKFTSQELKYKWPRRIVEEGSRVE